MRSDMTGLREGHGVGRRGLQRCLSIVVLAVVVLSVSAVGGLGSAGAATTPSGLGPLPPNWNLQSRCEGLHVGSHVVFPGQKVVATASAGICGGPPENTFGWGVNQVAGAGMHHCGENSTFCEFTAGAATNAYTTVCISGSNQQGAWGSCDYYAVVGKTDGIIEGYVKNEDGSPVAGVTVDAKGTHGTSTSTGSDGYYAMVVQPGSYQIVPSGGGSKTPFHPAMNTTTIAAGTSGTADFTLDEGTKLKLHLAQISVAADGIEVVSGTVTTTLDGKPTSVGVQLQGMPGVSPPAKAVTSGPRASVCSGGTRVWPPSTATLQDPSGVFTTVTTDATGHYAFTVAVGTTPGVWSLEAWAESTTGQLSGYSAAHETQSLTLDPLPGPKVRLSDFATEFDKAAQAKTAGLDQISDSANTMVNTLAQADATDSRSTGIGSFGFALVNAKDGQSVLVFPADSPPEINAAGEIAPTPGNGADLVIDPAEWAGTGLPVAALNVSLQQIFDSGSVDRIQIPTLLQFDAGTHLPGWKSMKGNQITLFSSSFEFLGWGYAGIGAAGSCY